MNAVKLRMLIDSWLDSCLFDRQIDIAGAIGLEEGLAQLGADSPIVLEGVDIGDRDAAFEVAFNVLKVLRRLAVDIAWQVEVEVVLLDLVDGNHSGETRHSSKIESKVTPFRRPTLTHQLRLKVQRYEAKYIRDDLSRKQDLFEAARTEMEIFFRTNYSI
jgi:hypothetical protein